MAVRSVSGPSSTWHHIVNPSAKDFAFVKKIFRFSAADLQLVKGPIRLPRFSDHRRWQLLALRVPSVSANGATVFLALTLIYKKNTVVTLADGGVPALDELSRRRTPPPDVSHLLAEILDALLDESEVQLDGLMDRIRHLEYAVRKGRRGRLTVGLGQLREDILRFDLLLEPLGSAMTQLMMRTPGQPKTLFAALRERVTAIHATLAHDSDLIDNLFQMHEALLAHRASSTIETLTVISVLLLPPTLVASFYGMNVEALPLSHDVRLVALVFAGTVAFFCLLVLHILRRFR